MPVLRSIDRRLLTRLPAFSPIAVRLLAVLADEVSSFKEVSDLIALDPVLAGEVLRLANSGLYGRRFEVRSILTAIAILGVGKLSQIAVTAVLWRGLPRRTSPFVRDWWRHSIAGALVARRASEDVHTDFAYTAALLHGVGQLALFQDAPHDYPNLVERSHVYGLDLLAGERDLFGVDHAALAGALLESWGCRRSCAELRQSITTPARVRRSSSQYRPDALPRNMPGSGGADAPSVLPKTSPAHSRNYWRTAIRSKRWSPK